MTRAVRLIADPIACDGRGLCAELLPELITLDDWGFPVISASDVPPGLQKETAAVARLCPRLALRLERAPSPGEAAKTWPQRLPGTGRADIVMKSRA
jgi:ferredoxin